MTVQELINQLQQYPQDTVVVDDYGILTPEDILIKHNWYNGDNADPHCEVIETVLLIQ